MDLRLRGWTYVCADGPTSARMDLRLRKQAYTTHRSVVKVDLVANDYKWEVLRVPGAGLDQEFVSPTV